MAVYGAVVVICGGRAVRSVEHGLPGAFEASGLYEGVEGEDGLPAGDAPSHAGSLHALCDEHFVCGFDNAGPDGEALVLQGAVAHAFSVLAEEGEFALDLARSVGGIVQVAQGADDLLHPVVTEDVAICLEPAGVARVGGCEMLARVPIVDGLLGRREAFQEGPVRRRRQAR